MILFEYAALVGAVLAPEDVGLGPDPPPLPPVAVVVPARDEVRPDAVGPAMVEFCRN